MKRVMAWSVSIVFACTVSAFAQNKVVFDNQSGEPALVKLIGPKQTEVEVPTGAKAGAEAAAGRYVIKVRYGTPGKYHYAKGQEFEVKETATTRSETTITLHKVVAGNYETEPISEDEFGRATTRSVATTRVFGFTTENIKYTRLIVNPPRSIGPASNCTFLIVIAEAVSLGTHQIEKTADITLSEGGGRQCSLRAVGLGVGKSYVEYLRSGNFTFVEPAEKIAMGEPGVLVMAWEVPNGFKPPVSLNYQTSKRNVQLLTFEEWKKRAEQEAYR